MSNTDYSTHYRSGDEIHIGDNARLATIPCQILFVLGRNEFPAEFEEGKAWWYEEFGKGFMLRQFDGALIFQEESDEDLTFVSRGKLTTQPPTVPGDGKPVIRKMKSQAKPSSHR